MTPERLSRPIRPNAAMERGALVVLSAVVLLVLVTAAGNSPWFGELSSLVNNGEYEYIVLVIDDERVLDISTKGPISDPSAVHVVSADRLESGREFAFVVDDQVGLSLSDVPESSTVWRLYFEEDRGIIIQKPASGPSVWIPLDTGEFRLSSVTSRDKALTPEKSVELLGLDFRRQSPPPSPPRPSTDGSVSSFLGFLALLVLFVAAVGYLWSLRRGRRGPGLRHSGSKHDLSEAERITLFDSVEEFNEFVAQLRAMDDPAAAIRLAFAYAEAGPGRLDERELKETPFEWRSRVGVANPDLAFLLSPILDPYVRVRFAAWPASSAAQMRAIDGLVLLVEEATVLAASGPAMQ